MLFDNGYWQSWAGGEGIEKYKSSGVAIGLSPPVIATGCCFRTGI
jgi:hypothetical protein